MTLDEFLEDFPSDSRENAKTVIDIAQQKALKKEKSLTKSRKSKDRVK